MICFLNIVKKYYSKIRLIIKRSNHTYPLDLRAKCNSPVAGTYYGFNQPVVIDASIENGRGRPLFTFGEVGSHPFIIAASKYLESRNIQYMRDVLANYYKSAVYKDAASLLITRKPIKKLQKVAPWGLVMPWENITPTEQEAHVIESVRKENERESFTAGIEKGWAWTGPTHQEKIEIECQRLKKVVDSIKKNGYKRHNGSGGDIPVVVLMKEDKWVWQAKTGQHRAIALSALGYHTIPLRVIKVVRKEDITNWPNVISKVYTIQEAHDIFDQIYYGQLPYMLKCYCDYISNNVAND